MNSPLKRDVIYEQSLIHKKLFFLIPYKLEKA